MPGGKDRDLLSPRSRGPTSASSAYRQFGSKARVVSVTERASERRQVGDRKTNTSELPFKCRKYSDDVETGG